MAEELPRLRKEKTGVNTVLSPLGESGQAPCASFASRFFRAWPNGGSFLIFEPLRLCSPLQMGDTCDLEEPDRSTFDDPRRGRKSSRRGNAWLRQTHPTSPSNSIAFLRGPNLRFGPDIHPLQGSHRPGVEQQQGGLVSSFNAQLSTVYLTYVDSETKREEKMDQDKLTHEFRNVTSEDEASTPNIRPQRTATRSMKAKEIYGTSREEHCRKLDAAWRNVDYRSSQAANSSEASQELEIQKAIDADREAIVSEKLREATQHERDNIQETASQFSISAHSRASSRSRRSGSSTISLAAAQARAQAEAVKAKAEYGRKEAAMRLEKARIEAELEVLQHEKEAAAADAQASALEAAAEQDGGECVRPHPPVDRTQRVSSYITEQASIRDDELASLRATVVQSRSQSLDQAETTSRHTDLRDYRQPYARFFRAWPNGGSFLIFEPLRLCSPLQMGDTCDLEEPDRSTFDDPQRGRKSSRRGNAWLRQTHPTSPSNSIAFLRGLSAYTPPDLTLCENIGQITWENTFEDLSSDHRILSVSIGNAVLPPEQAHTKHVD
ncbi:hypothetical protein HPB50_018459 [Hyalomma asiaticum]|uniref:Uncharacterized protein n=1 Tax=Hyalomma asiaticum TaxID=266040 RepID=A0ACB7TK42_HYAAI|nr:hypothetical protein HPB50_018459 [Hyalomma asiaticum]